MGGGTANGSAAREDEERNQIQIKLIKEREWMKWRQQQANQQRKRKL